MNNQRDTQLAESFPSVSFCLCNLDIEALSVKMIEYIVVFKVLHDDPHETNLYDESEGCANYHKSHDWRE